MALTMKEKRAVTKEVAARYQRAAKKERGLILGEFVKLTGYNRSYAAYLLRNWGRRARVRIEGRDVVMVLGAKGRKEKRKVKRKYGQRVLLALKRIWIICDLICSKRLHPFLPEIVPVLEGFWELNIDDEVRKKLIEISPATIDRLLALEKKKFALKPKSKTKPGTLLKNQIPIRTFADLR